MTKFDLHMHSDASSDGQFTPAELAAIAKEAGLEVIALCDHDTTQNVAAMIEEGKKAGLEVLPGIEVTTSLGKDCVHLLGYGIDTDDPFLNSLAANLQKNALGIFHERVEKLCKKYSLEVDEEEILKKANGKNPWFTLIDTILTYPEVQQMEDFQDYLPGGSRCDPAPVNFYWDNCQPGSDLYVEVEYPDLLEMIEKIHQAKGVAIIAHPFKTFYKREDLLDKVIQAGADGIEVYSNYHTPEQTAWYRKFAKDHNLLVGCGSDFHGEKKPSIKMGDYHMEEDGTPYLEALKARMQEMRQ